MEYLRYSALWVNSFLLIWNTYGILKDLKPKSNKLEACLTLVNPFLMIWNAYGILKDLKPKSNKLEVCLTLINSVLMIWND